VRSEFHVADRRLLHNELFQSVLPSHELPARADREAEVVQPDVQLGEPVTQGAAVA